MISIRVLFPQRKRVKISQMGGTENAKKNPNDSVLTVCASGSGEQAQEIVAGTQASADPEEGTSKHNPGPLVVPTRAHLDGVRRLMRGDFYIGRGCKQRNLQRSPFANPYKVSVLGAEAAVSLQRHSEMPRRHAHLRVPSAVPGCI